jgi:hypothetical protein
LFDGKKMGSLEILFLVRDFSTAFTMALLVVLFLFLVRWHVLERIEHLRQMAAWSDDKFENSIHAHLHEDRGLGCDAMIMGNCYLD